MKTIFQTVFVIFFIACGHQTQSSAADGLKDRYEVDLKVDGPLLPRAILDLGIVNPEGVSEFLVTINNRTNDDFSISNVRTSCGCVHATLKNDALNSGGSIELAVQFDPPNRTRSPFGTTTVILETGSRAFAELQIVLVYQVGNILNFKQRMVLLRQMPENGFIDLPVYNTTSVASQHLVVVVEKSLSFLDATLVTEPHLAVRLASKVSATFPVEATMGKIFVISEDGVKEAAIAIYARPQDEFRIAPESIRLRGKGAGNLEQSMEGFAIARIEDSQDDETLIASSIGFPDKHNISVKRLASGVYRVTISLPKESVEKLLERRDNFLKEDAEPTAAPWNRLDVAFRYGHSSFSSSFRLVVDSP